jgi:4-amino-4-deoxy-L-arabinose transferase-like glycosyltransferase
MPLHLVIQAGWYRLFGFSLFSMRSVATLWGLIGLACWYYIVKALYGSRNVAALTFLLLAFDYIFVMAASFGRMDMMSAALGSGAFAGYLLLRERNLTYAILVGQTLVVACGLTHPNGGVLFFSGLVFLTLYFDRARLRWYHLAVALIPYFIGSFCWGAYILRAPSLFLSQFKANASMAGRMNGLTSPLEAFKNEITLRYLTAFGMRQHSIGHAGPIRLKIFILLAYLIAIIGSLSVASLRRNRGYRALLILLAMYFLILTLFDGQKLSFYLIHIIPLYTAILAIWIHWCWTSRIVPRWLVALGLFSLISLQVGGIVYRAILNPYSTSYIPAMNVLKQQANKTSVIMGSAVVGFELGFDNLVDDVRLGFYSGRRPDFIVIGETYESALTDYRTDHPEIYGYVEKLLSEQYDEIYNRNLYRIYARTHKQR